MKKAIRRWQPILLVVFLFLFTCPSMAQNAPRQSALFGRKYKQGETYRYKLTMEELHDGKWHHTNVSICELKVVKDSMGVPYDEVHWISKKTFSPKDTVDETKEALSATPYRISLDHRGKIDLPKIEVPALTEPIQDFNTFFVAVSPMLGTASLTKKGDSSMLKDPVIADFSNGSFILKGEDCIAIAIKMTGDTKDQVMLLSSFSPPSKSCLSFLLPEMNTPVIKDTINNFQMVMRAGQDLYNVQWGREYFHINTRMQKSDGKILYAEMYNTLNLKLKINCNQEYKNCQFEMPFSEQRNLKLELL